MIPFSNLKKYDELKKRFRNAWSIGSTAAFEGIFIFNEIVKLVYNKMHLSVKEILFYFLVDNSDLVGLNPSNLVSYLIRDYKILYKRGL